MPDKRGPLIFGLTGNMGCGKSTVARFLKEIDNGIVIFGSDQIAKDLLCDKKHETELKEILGPEIFSDSKVDFKKVAALIFNDPEKKRTLETFIHALVWQDIHKRIASDKTAPIFIIESALIYEIGWENRFDGVIVVTCEPNEQRRRLLAKGLSQDEIELRLSQQLPSEIKARRAQFVIDTACSLEILKEKVADLYNQLKNYEKTSG